MPTAAQALTIEEQLHRHLDKCTGPVAVPVEADKLLAKLEERDPDALSEWLWNQRHRVVTDRLRGMLAARRNEVRRQAARLSSESFLSWLDVPYSFDHTSKVLGDMTHHDLGIAADEYDVRAKGNALEAAFLRAIQRKMPREGKTVAQVLDDEALAKLRPKG
jgi:hypothetical protein